MGRPESFDFGADSADPDLASGQAPEFLPLGAPPAFEVPEFAPVNFAGSVNHTSAGMNVTDRRFLLGAALVVLVVHHLLRRWSR